MLHVIATIGFMFGLTGTALGALAVLSMPGGVDLSAVRLKILGDQQLRAQMSPNFYAQQDAYQYNGVRGQQYAQDNMYRYSLKEFSHPLSNTVAGSASRSWRRRIGF